MMKGRKMTKAQSSRDVHKRPETGIEIRNWGPIRMTIDERSNRLWDKIELEAIERTLPQSEDAKLVGSVDLTRSDFYRALEELGRLQEHQPEKGKSEK